MTGGKTDYVFFKVEANLSHKIAHRKSSFFKHFQKYLNVTLKSEIIKNFFSVNLHRGFTFNLVGEINS